MQMLTKINLTGLVWLVVLIGGTLLIDRYFKDAATYAIVSGVVLGLLKVVQEMVVRDLTQSVVEGSDPTSDPNLRGANIPGGVATVPGKPRSFTDRLLWG